MQLENKTLPESKRAPFTKRKEKLLELISKFKPLPHKFQTRASTHPAFRGFELVSYLSELKSYATWLLWVRKASKARAKEFYAIETLLHPLQTPPEEAGMTKVRPETLDAARKLLALTEGNLPYVAPLPYGEIYLEWVLPTRRSSIELKSYNKTVLFHSTDLISKQSVELKLNLNSTNATAILPYIS